MTRILEHKIFRYTWELVRHTYIVDLESEIEIRQVEISLAREHRLLDPPYPFTPFFEIEIDQIQKNGKTVFSFRNICPVEINRKPAGNFLNSLLRTGGPGVTKRFQSQEGEAETRWLYADDFFLISLSSGDRHDLSMLISQILGKLNMIALSIQSGRRIRSEFENQQKYRAAMSTMFSEGVDGAFRDVPVYQQHGEVTESIPAESIPVEIVPAEYVRAESIAKGYTPAWSIQEESVPAAATVAAESVPATSVTADNGQAESDVEKTIPAQGETAENTPAWSIREESIPVKTVAAVSVPAERDRTETMPVENITADRMPDEHDRAEYVLTDSILADTAPEATVNTESTPASPGIPAGEDSGKAPAGARKGVNIVVDLKPIEELQDLSWLSD